MDFRIIVDKNVEPFIRTRQRECQWREAKKEIATLTR